mgnify:CR=1 FL=1
MVLNKLRPELEKISSSLALPLFKIGLKPHHLTIAGLLLSCLSLLSFLLERPYGHLALISAIILSSLMDVLDGALARISKTVSKKGSFTDSLADRIADTIFILAVLPLGTASSLSSLLFLATSLIVSYTRAKGESLGVTLSGVGLMERGERIILLIIALAIDIPFNGFLEYALWAGSLLNIYTIVQRARSVMKAIASS